MRRRKKKMKNSESEISSLYFLLLLLLSRRHDHELTCWPAFAHKFTISLEVEIVIHFFLLYVLSTSRCSLTFLILFYVPFRGAREHVTQKIIRTRHPKSQHFSYTLSPTIRQFAVAFFVFFFLFANF